MSPALVDKYLSAAKEIADHAVFLPDRFRFSASAHQRDWVDECLAALQTFYNPFTESDGRLPLRRYLSALVANRKPLDDGSGSFDEVARRENLSSQYLKALWGVLNDGRDSYVFAGIRRRWKSATPANFGEVAAEIEAWQKVAWVLDDRAAGIYEPWQKPANRLVDLQPAFLMPLPEKWKSELDRQLDEFRRAFPIMLCFGKIVPRDPDGITLRMFCREDEPLSRLMLSGNERKQLDRIWQELQYVGREAEREREAYPLFMGFASQVGLVPKFEPLREPIRVRAEAFQKEMLASEPRHLAALVDFAARAYRRPLAEQEKTELTELYHALRGKGLAHEEAMRGVLAKLFVSATFLFHLERSPAGKEAREVSDWELASRLSYFLWSSMPDNELRRIAAAGKLREPAVLAEQTRRMLKDGRIRALAIEFGAQSLHVRGFDEQKEKNERLFPTFDAELRSAIYDETILFFQDLFLSDRPITDFLDADYTFLNETLAAHYGIPGVAGSNWRRVEGVKKFGRGGVLGLASVQASQSGASRTSPVLRGKLGRGNVARRADASPAGQCAPASRRGDTRRRAVRAAARRKACQRRGLRHLPRTVRSLRLRARELRRDRPISPARSRRRGDRLQGAAEGRNRIRGSRRLATLLAHEKARRGDSPLLPAAAQLCARASDNACRSADDRRHARVARKERRAAFGGRASDCAQPSVSPDPRQRV
jgi:hypothetical protein